LIYSWVLLFCWTIIELNEGDFWILAGAASTADSKSRIFVGYKSSL
jgi:hypothetical protein